MNTKTIAHDSSLLETATTILTKFTPVISATSLLGQIKAAHLGSTENAIIIYGDLHNHPEVQLKMMRDLTQLGSNMLLLEEGQRYGQNRNQFANMNILSKLFPLQLDTPQNLLRQIQLWDPTISALQAYSYVFGTEITGAETRADLVHREISTSVMEKRDYYYCEMLKQKLCDTSKNLVIHVGQDHLPGILKHLGRSDISFIIIRCDSVSNKTVQKVALEVFKNAFKTEDLLTTITHRILSSSDQTQTERSKILGTIINDLVTAWNNSEIANHQMARLIYPSIPLLLANLKYINTSIFSLADNSGISQIITTLINSASDKTKLIELSTMVRQSLLNRKFVFSK